MRLHVRGMNRVCINARHRSLTRPLPRESVSCLHHHPNSRCIKHPTMHIGALILCVPLPRPSASCQHARPLHADYVLFETKSGTVHGVSARMFNMLGVTRKDIAAGAVDISAYFQREAWQALVHASRTVQTDTVMEMLSKPQLGSAASGVSGDLVTCAIQRTAYNTAGQRARVCVGGALVDGEDDMSILIVSRTRPRSALASLEQPKPSAFAAALVASNAGCPYMRKGQTDVVAATACPANGMAPPSKAPEMQDMLLEELGRESAASSPSACSYFE